MAFSITNVTYQTFFSTLGFYRSTFSLQESLFPGSASVFTDSSYNSSSYLFADACNLGHGTRNCTASCSNGTMFRNLQDLHNCAAYQTVAEQYQKNELTREAQALADALNIEPASPNSTLVSNITQNIQNCLVDYCKSIHGCEDAYQTFDPTSGQSRTSPSQLGNDFDLYTDGEYLVGSICYSLPFQINTDVGGIGIYISYRIQTGLSLLGFLAAMLFDSWIYYGCVVVLAIPHGFRQASRKARTIQLHNKEHLCRLVAALTDFQKAQSIFMSSINIAALVATHRGTLEPRSIDQLSLTYHFTGVIALGGLVPVTFTLFTLHLVDMCSWYLIFLSSISIALSTATILTIGQFNPDHYTLEHLSSYASSDGPSSCNSWQPGAYCYNPNPIGTAVKDVAWSTLGFCLFVLVLVISKQSKILTSQPAQHCLSWTSKKLAPCLPLLTVPARYIHKAIYLIRRRLGHRNSPVEPFDPDTDYPRIIGRIAIAMFYNSVTSLYIIWFSVFCYTLTVAASVLSTSWGFGQVLAVMIWAQPLCEYVQLEFRGMKRGMDHKIMPPYRMIRDDENLKVVGGDIEDDTEPEGYSLNHLKGPSVSVTPADGDQFDQKTGYNTMDITEIIPVHRGSMWDARRDDTDCSRLMG